MAGHRRRSGKKLLGYAARGNTTHGDRLGDVPAEPKRKKTPGIRNEQAKELGRLQRQLGERYTGSGMTAMQAARAIDAARARLERRQRP